MPAVSSNTRCQISSGSDHPVDPQQVSHSSYMKGTSQKRSRIRTRRRRKRSPKKGEKMLPARVARLLGSSKKLVKAGKNVLGTAGKSGKIRKLTGWDLNTSHDVANVCNIDISSRTFSTKSSCEEKCGADLCLKSDVANKTVADSLTCATKSFLPSSVQSAHNNGESACTPESTPFSSERTARCVAIDCEMVGVGVQAFRSALARCSIVNYEGDVVYDKYVKPDLPITDYRTPWSGIVEEHMTCAIPFLQARKEVSEILKNKIVVGHSVGNDFRVLELKHPSEDIRDTSRYRGLRYMAGEDSAKRAVGLKAMTARLLQKQIQTGPHCSVEDARATMSLYRLVDKHWEEEVNSLYPDRQFKSCFLDDHFWPDDL